MLGPCASNLINLGLVSVELEPYRTCECRHLENMDAEPEQSWTYWVLNFTSRLAAANFIVFEEALLSLISNEHGCVHPT